MSLPREARPELNAYWDDLIDDDDDFFGDSGSVQPPVPVADGAVSGARRGPGEEPERAAVATSVAEPRGDDGVLARLERFIDENCAVDPRGWVATRDLRDALEQGGYLSVSAQVLGSLVATLGRFERARRGTGHGWNGLRLAPQPGEGAVLRPGDPIRATGTVVQVRERTVAWSKAGEVSMTVKLDDAYGRVDRVVFAFERSRFRTEKVKGLRLLVRGTVRGLLAARWKVGRRTVGSPAPRVAALRPRGLRLGLLPDAIGVTNRGHR